MVPSAEEILHQAILSIAQASCVTTVEPSFLKVALNGSTFEYLLVSVQPLASVTISTDRGIILCMTIANIQLTFIQ